MLDRNSADLMRYDAQKKSVALTYVFWILLGSVGVHRVYAGREPSGVVMLIGTIASVVMVFTVPAPGFLAALIMTSWVIIDGFLIPGWISSYNLSLADRITKKNDIEPASSKENPARTTLFSEFMDLPAQYRIGGAAAVLLIVIIVVSAIR